MAMSDTVVKTRLRDLSEDADLKQREVAAAIHVAQTTYSAYELGTVNIPATALIALADFYNTSIDYILFRSDKR